MTNKIPRRTCEDLSLGGREAIVMVDSVPPRAAYSFPHSDKSLHILNLFSQFFQFGLHAYHQPGNVGIIGF